MKINKKTNKIKTLSKEEFDNLSKSEKQIAVAKDVLDRIKVKQLLPTNGRFCRFINMDSIPVNVELKPIINVSTTTCEVCAKGGLFMSYIGIVNNYKLEFKHLSGGEENKSDEMRLLSKIFRKKQLTLIETAFEGTYYPNWNATLTNKEVDKCIAFNTKHYVKKDESTDNEEVLVAICKNIIANEGTFKP